LAGSAAAAQSKSAAVASAHVFEKNPIARLISDLQRGMIFVI
jgi:hypothetical protein